MHFIGQYGEDILGRVMISDVGAIHSSGAMMISKTSVLG